MKAETKALIAILLLPGLLAEILSTNIPFFNFLNPFVFIIIALVYGCGSLLIREARVKWKMQWSIVFLAVAYGIFEEGLVTRAFFNPYWFGEGALSANWMFFGVQWGWTILLLVFHASISTLIPIYLVENTWPKVKKKPLVGKRGIGLALLGTMIAIAIGMVSMGGADGRPEFFPNPMILVGSVAVMAVLIWLAINYRKNRLSFKGGLLSATKITLFAFILQAANMLIPNILASANAPALAGIAIHLLVVLSFAMFAATQLFNKKTKKEHVVAYVLGSVLFWIAASFVIGVFGRIDLLIASPVALLLLLLWREKTLRK